MAMTATVADAQPMSELNTTPLIDVMLVLLIMFILSIPAAYHSLEITLPPPPQENEVIPPVRSENVVGVDAKGTMIWNGMPVSESVLVAALGNATLLKPEPLVKFQPDAGAPYGVSARAMSLVKASGVTAFAFVGNEQFANFAKAAPPR